MMNRKFVIVSLSLLMSASALAGVKVTSLNYVKEGGHEKIKIQLDGRTTDLPDVVVKNQTIEIFMSNSDAFDSIKKDFDGRVITASKKDGKAYIKATLPGKVIEDSMNVDFKNNQISLSFKSEQVVPKRAPKDIKTAKPVENKKLVAIPVTKKESLNEDYLTQLSAEDKQVESKPAVAVIDAINTTQAAPEKKLPETKKTNDFSMIGYAAKFTIFLAAVLGIFYGVVQLLKKGLFNKGKLGFLNNSSMIEVLSTTYIAPKRSLMIVKAHKQIFLVSNSETGISFLSEMTDTAGIFKEGEKILTGTNFDADLSNLDSVELTMKLKENIHESTPAPTKDVAKFSEELKKKAKKLKPIEFN